MLCRATTVTSDYEQHKLVWLYVLYRGQVRKRTIPMQNIVFKEEAVFGDVHVQPLHCAVRPMPFFNDMAPSI